MRIALPAPGVLIDGRWIGRAIWHIERTLEQAKAKDETGVGTRGRILAVMLVVSVVFIVLSAGAVKAALFTPDARAGALANLPAGARADLVDRNGELLAANLLHFGMFIDPREVWDATETKAALARALPDIKADRIAKAVDGSRRIRLMGGLTPAERDRILDLGLPGISFEPEEARVYPLGSTAVHLIGFTDTGGAGLAGAEKAFENKLAGLSGPVALSIDLRVQAALDDEIAKTAAEFKPIGAVGLVIDTQTGEVLGMSSWPNYDPNGRASADQRLNRAAASVFEMGSTFKAFTVAAGLDAGVATPTTMYDASAPFKFGYRTISDMHSEGRSLSLVDVFTHSSNVGTARLAQAIGRDRMHDYFDKLGLRKKATVELAESTRPLLPRKWDDDDMLSTSFGHGMQVTPLALAQAYSAIVNDGKRVPLTILKRSGPPPKGEQVMSVETSQTMLQIMRANVVRGTGRSANASGLSVGGKTGTGEKVVNGRYDSYKQIASFAAAFPTTGGPGTKRYFVLVLVDEPQGGARTGGIVAAPAVGRVVDRIAEFLKVPRQDLSREVVIGAPPPVDKPEEAAAVL